MRDINMCQSNMTLEAVKRRCAMKCSGYSLGFGWVLWRRAHGRERLRQRGGPASGSATQWVAWGPRQGSAVERAANQRALNPTTAFLVAPSLTSRLRPWQAGRSRISKVSSLAAPSAHTGGQKRSLNSDGPHEVPSESFAPRLPALRDPEQSFELAEQISVCVVKLAGWAVHALRGGLHRSS